MESENETFDEVLRCMLQECKVRRNRKVWYMQSYEVAQGIERSE